MTEKDYNNIKMVLSHASSLTIGDDNTQTTLAVFKCQPCECFHLSIARAGNVILEIPDQPTLEELFRIIRMDYLVTDCRIQLN